MAKIVRAIREGIDNDGHALLVHPANDYHLIADADAIAVTAVPPRPATGCLRGVFEKPQH
jgi:hypothetical protein